MRGPHGEWRPADAVGCAVHVAKIATGEAAEELANSKGQRKAAPKNPEKGPSSQQ